MSGYRELHTQLLLQDLLDEMVAGRADSATLDERLTTIESTATSLSTEVDTISEDVDTISTGIYYASNYSSFAAAVTAIGSTVATLVVADSQTITASLDVATLAPNATVVIIGGGYFTGESAVTLNLGMFDAPRRQVFYGVTVTFSDGAVGDVKPEWWTTNTTPGTTDMSGALQKAIDCAIRNQLPKIKVSGKYYLESKVNVYVPDSLAGTVSGNILIEGDNPTSAEDSLEQETCFYGSSGLSCLFDIGNGKSNKMFGVEFHRCKFNGDTGATDVVSAIKITSAYTGPLWPLVVDKCGFWNFTTAAIYVDQDSLTYNMAFMRVMNSTFRTNGYAVFLDETTAVNRCYGLYWVNNCCHQNTNGAIRGAFGGGITIMNNNFEGQPTPIYITGNNVAPHAVIKANYFESNTGDYLIQITSTATGTVDIANNIYVSCTPTTYIRVARCSGRVDDNVSTAVGLCSNGSIGVKNLVHVEGWDYTGQCYDADYALRQNPKGGVSTEIHGYYSIDGVISTPLGPKPYKNILSSLLAIHTYNQAVSSGEFVTLNLLVRYTDWSPGSNSPTVAILDGATSKKTIYSANPKSYDWVVLSFTWEADESLTDLEFQFNPYGAGSGDGCYIAGAYIIISADREISPHIPVSPNPYPVSYTSSQYIREGFSGSVFDNTGATGDLTHLLPSAKPGLEYTFVRNASHALRLDPSGTETIRGGGAGKYLELDTDGDSVHLKCFQSGVWEIVGGYGTYAYE